MFLEVSITPSSLWGGQGLLGKTYYSQLSPNGHLYETDTSVKLTPRVGLWFPLFPYLTVFKIDNTLRQTLCAGPKGAHLREK